MFEQVDDRSYYALPRALDGYFGDDIAPAVYQSALGPAEWSVDTYNFLMQLMHTTLLTWDSSGWNFPRGGTGACWRQHPERYAQWKNFLGRFALQFRKGWIPTYSYVSDADEAAGRHLLRQTQAWGRWFDTACTPNLARTRTASTSRLSGLESFGALPLLYVMAGTAVAAGATVSAWLTKTEWAVGEYNYYMRLMDATIKAWDKLGWTTGCWQKHPDRREMWKSFWAQFSAHYARYGTIPDYSYVSDSAEKPARDLMTRLAEWGNWLNTECGAHVSGITPPPGPTDDSDSATGFLKWGALLALGVFGVKALSAAQPYLRR